MEHSATDFEKLLQALVDHDVAFVVVGGLAAVLQGAPIMTLDVDIVHRRDAPNISRLLRALGVLKARYRGRASDLSPKQSHLESEGHQLLMTKFGPLDILGAIGTHRTYEDLLQSSRVLEIGELHVRVLSLGALIQVKEELGQPKDRAVLEILRETLRECGNG